MPRVAQPARLYSHLRANFRRKSTRQRSRRLSVIAINTVIISIIALFVVQSPHSGGTPKVAALHSASTASIASEVNPLDHVSSADIALTVARMNSLPESTAISNQAQSAAVSMSVQSASDGVSDKPQVVATSLKSSADIQTYTSVAGDSLTSLAQKFGVTSDSIRWSNNLTSDAVNPGTKLVIPPVNGIVYSVKAGDTTDMLAQKYNANKDKIVAFNDAEIKGLVPGSQIVIPDGTIAVVGITAAQIAKNSAAASFRGGASFPWGGAPIYGSNGYDYGYCTWYVANKLPVPSNWGNANTWDNLAPQSGWTVSTVPRAGAIAQSDRGAEGHVAYVEAVSPDGAMIKYSDMNGLAGFGRVGYSDWAPASHFMHYIYR